MPMKLLRLDRGILESTRGDAITTFSGLRADRPAAGAGVIGVRFSDSDGVPDEAEDDLAGVRAPAAEAGRDDDEEEEAVLGAGTAKPDDDDEEEGLAAVAAAGPGVATLRGVVRAGVAAAAKEEDRLTEALRAAEVLRLLLAPAAAPAAGLAEVGVPMVAARCRAGLAGDAVTTLP